MTEQEWLAAADPQPMLEFLRDKVSDRKLRLLAVACCRGLWHLLEKPGRRAIEISEEYADGLATAVDLDAALSSLPPWKRHGTIGGPVDVRKRATDAVPRLLHNQRLQIADVLRTTAEASARDDEFPRQAGYLREIFGSLPFRPVTFDRSWLTRSVTDLAQTSYTDRHLPSGLFDNHCLGILTDALQDGGCDNDDILNHLRQPGGKHVRGCWAVDLILAKE